MNVKDLFQKAIEWLRRRVTALKREEGRVKREKVENTRGVYDNENLIKVKGERLEGSKARISKVERRHHNDDDKSFNSHLSSFNSKLTIPEIEALLRERGAVLSREQVVAMAWDSTWQDPRIVDTNVQRLRRKQHHR